MLACIVIPLIVLKGLLSVMIAPLAAGIRFFREEFEIFAE